MRKLYPFFALLFANALVSAMPTPPELIPDDKMAEIRRYLTYSEYFIHWQPRAAAYQSPNRNNGLQVTYTGQDVKIAPSESTQDWAFSLSVKGIAAGGRLVYKPVSQPAVSVNDNTIRFNHADNFTVEYVNSEQGLRQNFIVQRPLSRSQQLSVQLQTAEGWTTEKLSPTSLSFKHQQQLLTYNDLKVWDAKGTVLAAHFTLVNQLVQIEVDTRNAVYPITIDPIVVNGTPQNAWLFLQPNHIRAFLGCSVSGAGDLNSDGYDDIVVGASNYSDGQNREGITLVYYGSAQGINPTTPTRLQIDKDTAEFGTTVAGAGDVNGDGYDDILVSAPFVVNSPFLGFAGRFYVYYGSATGVSNTAYDMIEGTNNYASLGEQLSPAGDVNGDGFDDILVGAYGAMNQFGVQGIVWVYYGGTWGIQYTAPSQIEGYVASGTFARSISNAGDVNGDGFDDIILGSLVASPVSVPGRAEIYYGGSDGISLTPNTILKRNTLRRFGERVSAAGDINGDGWDDVLISSVDEGAYPVLKDTVFVYYGSATGVDSIPDTVLPGAQHMGGYGWSLASAGDINADGFGDIIVGSFSATSGQNQEGMAFVYYGRAIGINPTPASTIQSNLAVASLGFSIACAGDVNGDGYDDIIIGAPTYASGHLLEGAAFLYKGGAGSAGFAAQPLLAAVAPAAGVSVKAFPNPVINHLSVKYEGLDVFSNTSVQVMNAQGIIVKSIAVGKVNSGSEQIDVSKLMPGLYIVIVQNGSNTFKEKIIKQ